MNEIGEVHTYGSGTAEFSVGDLRVQVRHATDSTNAGARELAEQLRSPAESFELLRTRLNEASRKADADRKTIYDLHIQLSAARALNPKTPARLLARGTVRFRDGKLWLMNRRENGWASFGIRLDDWDELFRRFNVRVTDHGEDEHGAWWGVENCG